MELQISIDGGDLRGAVLARNQSGATIWIDGTAHRATFDQVGRFFELSLDGQTERVWVAADHDEVFVHAFGRAWRTEIIDPIERAQQDAEQADLATAPMPGTAITVSVTSGDTVQSGQPLLVIESMKMQSEIVAWRDGVVERVHIAAGDTFDRGAGLVALIPEEAVEE